MPDRSDHRPRLTILTGHAGGVPPVVEPLEDRQFLSGSAVSIAATGLLTDMGVVVAAAVPWAAPAGESGANGMGTSSGRGQLLVIAVAPAQSPPRVTDLTIVNAADGSALGPLVDGVDLTLPPGASSISIISGAAGSVGSVVFAVDGRRVHVENSAPYSIAGESGNGVFKPWTPPTGSHTLTVTPYMGQDGAGASGTTVTIHFTAGAPKPTPTPTPTPIPTPTPTPTPTPAPTSGFPTQISWKTGAPSPIVRAEALGGPVGGKLYVFGGFNNQGSASTSIPLQSRCDYYDPATNTWHRLRDYPEPFTHSEEVIVGTDIWFVGGYVGNHPGPGTTHVWVYHTTDDTWARGPDLPQPRGAGAAALVGSTIYFAGGMDQTRTIDESTTYALDLNNPGAGWVQKANLPNGRNHVAAATVNGFFYVIGGQHGQEDQQVSQTEVDRYDPTTNTWTKVASLPSGRSHITEATFNYMGRIIVIGGETASGTQQRSIFTYNPVTNSWSTLGFLPARRSTVVCGIINGQLIVTTGNSPPATTTTWIGTLS
jgi:N-acetylneuraminic acid mutarotase